MSDEKIVRAWKDAEYREGLSEEELAHLPENPAGESELSDEDLEQVDGGIQTSCIPTVDTGTGETFGFYCPPPVTIEY